MQHVKHCHGCGEQYQAEQMTRQDNRTCHGCGTLRWFNPIPVSVLLQPVYWHTMDPLRYEWKYGLLVGRRTIQPKMGEYGLPGGFVLGDPSYESAAAREAGEEITLAPELEYPACVGAPQLWFSLPGDPSQILSFAMAPKAIPLDWLGTFSPNEECDAVDVIWEPQQLCFSGHTHAAERFFQQKPHFIHEQHLGMKQVGQAYQNYTSALRKNCPHKWEPAPDLYDYHKREEFQRCNLCGSTV